jgi:TolB-like protein
VSERYRVADLDIDVRAGTVTKGGLPVVLPPLTFTLLLALVRRAPNVVSRETLLETVWPGEFVGDEVLSQRVKLLRRAIGDTTAPPTYIAGIRRCGYQMVAPVRRLNPARRAVASLAVLPLLNLTGDAGQDYFVDGMTDALTTAVSRISGLKVISRTSAMRYRRPDRPLPEIGRILGADALVEGSVMRAGDRVRVTLQLLDAAADEHLWADDFEHEMQDLLACCSVASSKLANAIQKSLAPEGAPASLSPVDPDALDAYLRGRHMFARFTPADLDAAMRHFERATALAPGFARAHASLAEACIYRGLPLGLALGVDELRVLLERAKAAAIRAREIDASVTSAHTGLAAVALFCDWDWDSALASARRAVTLDANCAQGHLALAMVAATLGDRDQTSRSVRAAVELDPLNLGYRAEGGEFCYWARDHGEAERYEMQVLEVDPAYPRAHFVIGRMREVADRIPEAIDAYEAAGLFTADAAAGARDAFAAGGRERYLRWRLHATPPRAYLRSQVHARLFDADNSIACLERAFEERDPLLVNVGTHEIWDPVRSDPRFRALTDRIGIPRAADAAR